MSSSSPFSTEVAGATDDDDGVDGKDTLSLPLMRWCCRDDVNAEVMPPAVSEDGGELCGYNGGRLL
jgi:hypothetical protein